MGFLGFIEELWLCSIKELLTGLVFTVAARV